MWPVIAIVVAVILFFFVLPKTRGFLGDIANIVIAILRVVLIIAIILIAVAFWGSIFNH